MNRPDVLRDERTVAAENASYRWAYMLLSFGMLASAAYRAFALDEQSWDLLALVLLGGVVTVVHQGASHVLTNRWLLISLATLGLAFAIAVTIALNR